MACGLWPVACGLWPVACGLWPVACGLWRDIYALGLFGVRHKRILPNFEILYNRAGSSCSETVPGTKFIDKNLSGKKVPGTFAFLGFFPLNDFVLNGKIVLSWI
jgi:hypothetical protein